MTRGRDALLAVLLRTTGREVASRCRVSPGCVSKWCSGRSRPSYRARETMESCYGIRRSAWDEPLPKDERARVAALIR